MERIEGYKIALEENLSKKQMYLMVALAETPEAITYPGISFEPELQRAKLIAKWIRVDELYENEHPGRIVPRAFPTEIYQRTPVLEEAIKKVRERYENS